MRYLLLTISWLFTLTALAAETAPAVNIDKTRVTVSGISSGAAMAHQIHIAYSDLFSGAAILSGVPYNCAENSLITALKRCTENKETPLPVGQFAQQIREANKAGLLADPANLADDRVYLFHGSLDTKVSSLVHDATGALYAEFISTDQLLQVNDIAAGHVFPVMESENNCIDLVPPFVGDCDYDGAGELLNYLYPGLKTPKIDAQTQLLDVTLPGADEADLMETAYLFVPSACVTDENTCAHHLV